MTLGSVTFIPGLKANLLSLHTIQFTERVILDNKGVHLMGGCLTFAQDGAGRRQNSTRRPPSLFPRVSPSFLPMHGAPTLPALSTSPGVMVGAGYSVAAAVTAPPLMSPSRGMMVE